MKKLLALSVLVASAGAGCGERPKTPSAVDRVVEENHKASEALVHAAKDAASKAGDQAQQAAEAAREAFDATTGPNDKE